MATSKFNGDLLLRILVGILFVVIGIEGIAGFGGNSLYDELDDVFEIIVGVVLLVAGLLLIEDATHITHSTFNKEKDIEMGTVLPVCPPKEKPMFVAPVRRSRSMGRPLLPKYRLCQSTESSLMLPKAFVASARRLR